MSRIKEKNIYNEKNFGTEPKIGYCPLSMRLGAGALGRAGERHGMGVRQGERARGARGRASGRAAGRAGARLGERARGWAQGARGWAHGARGARPSGSTGAQPVRTGWASWVLVHPAWFSAWFFDSVFFLSH